ncbi:flavin-dependent dehydrogenase [Desulfohalotomaculum tongense]|uniref:NAD(P)/FAD-dependent oxidoreductase n=1 Tax=Desulforadius tongensis TaxID=1216062 RepID=UPI0019579846|nr:NAD(P)/FAD-dependent oxidoreductase [Desulforadius tongensis]MBM7856185.1 flavin-dependent dehydrogenase [Desulforadius tongensis]
MKVVIIGAGLSGLCCAYELERHGIKPDVFEERSRSGELFPHVSAMMEMFIRPNRDPVKYLEREFHIKLKPLHEIKTIEMRMARVKRSVTGNLGYFFLRGQSENSVESQLSRMLKTKVHYNVHADYEQLSREYDYVIVCTGNSRTAKTLGVWDDLFYSLLRGVIVLGEFDTSKIIMWFNKKYNDTGYAYLTPFSSDMASLILIVRGIGPEELDDYWHLFWQNGNFNYKIVESFTLEHIAGLVYPHQLENILLAGNAGGFLEPFLGFGQISAIRSGVYAAQAVAQNKDYEKLLEPLKTDLSRSILLREYLNASGNRSISMVTRVITMPGIKQLVYNSGVDVLKYGTGLLKILDKLTGERISKQ